MMRFFSIIFLILILSGCATMVRGTTEKLKIVSEPEGATAKLSNGATCVTPCEVELKRKETVTIKFEKEGCNPEIATAVPTLAGSGVLLGGLIDYGTGAVYNLVPNPVHVILKCENKKADIPKNPD